MPRIGGRSDRCPKCQEPKVIRGRAPTPLLRGIGPRLSVASSLDGVMDVAVVVDPMAREGTPWRKVTSSLLSRLGALGLWPIRAFIGGVTAAPFAHGM
jgi:hypothetical protein